MSPVRRVGIVGAGMAGLAAARVLRESGAQVQLWDKGRSVGGRVSIRRAGALGFDHGAQYFTARDARFLEVLRPLRDEGLVAPWRGRIVAFPAGDGEGPTGSPREVDGSVERLVGVPAMNALPKALARGLDVRTGVRVERAELVDDGWRLIGAEGPGSDGGPGGDVLGTYEALLVTAPPAQAAQLLGPTQSLARTAETVAMRRAWAVLLGFEERYDVPFDGAFGNDPRLSWMARNSSKPGRGTAECWVLHGLAWKRCV